MQRSHITRHAIRVTQDKTGAELELVLHPNLLQAIKAGPCKGLYLIGEHTGRPITAARLSALVIAAAKVAGLPRECVPHGLRKALLRRLAEHGATTKQIAAVSGHQTLKEIERYTAMADQRQLAKSAIGRLWKRKPKNKA
jgi:integrase